MTTAEIKVCECCGRLFTRAAHPEIYHPTAGHMIEVPNPSDCPACLRNPPKEEDVPPVYHSYRVVGVRFS